VKTSPSTAGRGKLLYKGFMLSCRTYVGVVKVLLSPNWN